MRFLYDTLDFLPEAAQRPIVALMVIIIGYFLSKIFAALLSSIIPSRRNIIRSCFWVCWLGFLIIGYNQLPLLSDSMKLWMIGSKNYTPQFFIILGGGLLLIMDQTIESFYKVIKRIFTFKLHPKLKGVFGIMLQIVLMPVVVTGGWILSNPQTTGLKIAATLLLLLLGYLLGHVVKATVTSFINREMDENPPVTKFLFYCVWVTFFITAVGLWT